MFSDHPSEYCTYRVLDETGQPIDSERFGLHLIYDGNPPGLGMGIQAQPTLHEFGETVTLEQLKAHVQQKLTDMPERESLSPLNDVWCDAYPIAQLNQSIRFRFFGATKKPK